MKHWRLYLEKQKGEFLGKSLPHDFAADMVVVIPCFDEKELPVTLKSLARCEMPKTCISVVAIINSGIGSSGEAVSQNRKTYVETLDFASRNNSPTLRFYPFIFENLPRKHAGVGLARKIGMDLATRHFLQTETPHGIIVSLDADCTVSRNFFTGIAAAYRQADKIDCTVQNFKHRAEGGDSRIEQAVRQYEQYILYFSRMLRWVGFPYYHHTIGSAFSVSANAYVRAGGMGRQQGGEDFYFLQKVFAFEKTKRLDDVFVHPMARFSGRIPFGTGPALRKIIEEPDGRMKVYAPGAFAALKQFFDLIDSFYKAEKASIESQTAQLHPSLVAFIEQNRVLCDIADCNRNCASLPAFRKRFFHHFNAFRIIKFLNAAHESAFSPVPLPSEIEESM